MVWNCLTLDRTGAVRKGMPRVKGKHVHAVAGPEPVDLRGQLRYRCVDTQNPSHSREDTYGEAAYLVPV